MIAPRKAVRTVGFVDDYCAAYEDIFPEVRSFESFKYLHVGMISQIKRKSLPAIAKVVGLNNEQPLHHFLTDSPWDIKSLVERRLSLTLSMLKGESFILVIDKTGDKKKGNSTDYVSRQYVGNLGKVENGLVSVNAYGVLGTIVFPLTFKIFKPKTTLHEEDIYKTKKDILKERKNTTWYLMTNLPGEIKQTVGNTYGFRNWIEYGLKQAKNELGWADFRLTNYAQIQRWWETVCCVYLMVSWHSIARDLANKA